MMGDMKRFLLILVMTIAATALPFRPAFADDEDAKPNVKVEGYTRPVKLEDSSTALTYILLIFIGGICVAVMFKDAKRSHLD